MFHLIKYDLQIGIKERFSQIVLPVVAFCLCSVYSGGLNWGERLAIMFVGNYSQLEADNGGIPIYWLLVHIGCLLFSVEYPIRDLSLYGRQIVVRSQRKYKWWLSKSIWCFVNTLIYYFVGIITEAVFCIVFHDRLSFELRMIALSANIEMSVGNLGDTVPSLQAFLIVVILPLLTMIALSIIQTIIGIITNRIIALLGGLAVMASALYIQSPLLIGNYIMLQRNAVFNRIGLDGNIGIIIMLMELMILICIGTEVFTRMDILEPKKI